MEPTPENMAVLQEYGKFNRPIPGQSLTNDPENPAPYEKPPTHTNLKKAQEFIFEKLTEEEHYVPLMSLLNSGEATVMELTQNLLYSGFRAGKWNPDLMLMLAEPTAYMFMALAERAGIEYKVDEEASTDPVDEDEAVSSDFKEVVKKKAPSKAKVSELPESVQKRLAEAPTDKSLLEKEADEESLIEK